MAVKLGSLRANTRRESEGDWIAIPDLPGVELKVRGFNYGPYVTAKSLIDASNARRYFAKGQSVPPEQAYKNNARLYLDHILLDWRGLVDDDGNAVPFDQAEDFLTDPAYRELHEHIRYAGQEVGTVEAEFVETAAKNSPRSSAGSSAKG